MNTKKPFVTEQQVHEIMELYATPFYIYDEAGIKKNCQQLLKAFSWNSGFREYFAVKATPNPFILKLLADMGCGCDCSSLTELQLAKSLENVPIMFSSNDTPAKEFVFARKLPNCIINLDDISHIPFLKEHGGIPDTICCRFNTGGKFHVSENVMGTPEDAKYGMTEPQIIEAFKILRSLGVKKFSLHAFLASNTLTNEYYPKLAKVLFELAVKIKRILGISVSFINLSGGIGIPYHPSETKNDIYAISSGVRNQYDSILLPAGLGNIAIYTELGRYLLGPYGHLITSVIHTKEIYRNYIGVDACAANLMRPAMYGAYHHITVLGRENAPCTHTYDVTGCLCENNDKFAIQRQLPEIHVGDILVIHDTGAHGFSMGYNYNGRLRSAELLLREDGSVIQIRRAETPSDYFSTLCYNPCRENFPAWF